MRVLLNSGQLKHFFFRITVNTEQCANPYMQQIYVEIVDC
jgi:hypothetical protein